MDNFDSFTNEDADLFDTEFESSDGVVQDLATSTPSVLAEGTVQSLRSSDNILGGDSQDVRSVYIGTGDNQGSTSSDERLATGLFASLLDDLM